MSDNFGSDIIIRILGVILVFISVAYWSSSDYFFHILGILLFFIGAIMFFFPAIVRIIINSLKRTIESKPDKLETPQLHVEELKAKLSRVNLKGLS